MQSTVRNTQRSHRVARRPLRFWYCAICILHFALLDPLGAAEPLQGEFTDINLGRALLEPSRFPTVKELREAVRDPQTRSVVMLKLHADGSNHYLPTWSSDGKRLALQRSDIKQRVSKILVFTELSQPKPSVLDEASPSYDYMFRWGQSSKAGFAFSRIDSETGDVQVWYSADGRDVILRTKGKGRRLMPALYERTDGIWRLAYEKDGEVVLDAWRGEETIDEAIKVCRGTSPRWSSDGSMLLAARARGGKLGAFDIVLVNLLNDRQTQLSTSEIVRSPVFSPDERFAAFFAKDAGDSQPWRIEVASLASPGKARALVQDVVVNGSFESDEPTWEPSGRRVWCFSHRHRQQTYYPLVAVDVEGGREQVVHYPQRCTNPGDLAINPKTYVPELSFVGHDGLPQDLYILFLNHY